ncbi:MAG: hypothetical protein ACLQDV_22410 [Candidatus Binataceae bacterium]
MISGNWTAIRPMDGLMTTLSKWSVVTVLVSMISLPGLSCSAAKIPQASAAATPAASEEDEPQMAPTVAQFHFADLYIKAVNSKDLNALRRLIPPRTLACYSDRTQPYLSTWLERQFRDPIAKPYSITIEKQGTLPRSALFTLPVPPTHQINIKTTLNGDEVVLGRPIAYEDGRWYETAPCPTDIGIEQFQQRQELAKQETAALDKLYAQLKDPLLADLKNLIAQGKTLEACRKYAAATRIDYQRGCQVVRKLAATMGEGK